MRRWRPNLLQAGLGLLFAGGVGAWFHWNFPRGAATTGLLYVSEPTLDRVSVINLASGQILRHHGVGRLPHQLLADARGRVYVLETGSQSVSLLPAARDEQITRQRIIGEAPNILPHRAAGEQVMTKATSCKSCHKSEIQGSLPGSMAFTADRNHLWITELRGRRLSQVKVNGLETQEQIGVLGEDSSPARVLIHPGSGDIYVIARTYKGAMPSTAGIGELGLRIALDPEHAGSLGTSSVTVSDAQFNTIKGRLELPGAGAGAGVFSPDGRELFLALRGADQVAVIGLSPLRLLRTIATAPGPTALAWVGSKTLAVASLNTNPGVLQFFDGSTGALEHRIAVGANPAVLAFDQSSQKLYVGCTGNASVTEVDIHSPRVLREFKLEGHPGGLALVNAAKRM